MILQQTEMMLSTYLEIYDNVVSNVSDIDIVERSKYDTLFNFFVWLFRSQLSSQVL
ncbi:hypothetical protein SAMN05421839_1552 [Halolactibacillus halophilus]|uniref:Uncharacterized protein n=1 Tax=Halolactibacillus halophilus TaxID=306540 RepID=A0A1I5SY81_9BACI|nr:hypothetical protein HHA03_23370 [Halolactibacillus halophilus]SFP75709.1 hypothetical protein SAMN05421839_1552 [Halolactibacillus halophilus]